MIRTAEQRVQEYNELIGARANLDTQFQTLHDQYDLEAQNINKSYTEGEEFDFSYMYDTLPLSVADTLPAGVMNYLTPFGSQWMNLKHRRPEMNNKTEVGKWYKETQDEVFYILSKSNFYDQAFTFYKSSGVYGTANMYGESDLDDVVRFIDMPVKQCHIVDDAKGRVNEYYLSFEYTAKQAMGRFGKDALSEDMRKEIENPGSGQKKHKFFLYIGPRYDRNVMKKDATNMPWQGSWFDVKAQKMVQESGYESLNAWTHRFYKRPNEPYGFSPGMKALMDARFVGAMSYTEMQEAMQQSSPALAIPHDAFIQDLDFNPNAVNTYQSNKLNKDQIIKLGGYGDLQVNEMILEKKYAMLKEHWFYDVFLAFQGITKQMTVPEVMQRANERMSMLSAPVGRYQDAFLAKVIDFTMKEAFKVGRLPELPDALRNDPSYEIEYTSQLSLAHKQGELQALQTGFSMVGQLSQYKPRILDKINEDRSADIIWSTTGADPSAKNDDDEVAQEREKRALENQKADEMEQAVVGSGLAKTQSETAKNMQGVQ